MKEDHFNHDNPLMINIKHVIPVFVAGTMFAFSLATLNADPIIYYSFDGSSPYQNQGAATANLVTVNGASLSSDTVNGSGSSLQISSTGPAYASVSGVSGLSGMNSFTLTMWVQASSLTSNNRLFSTLGGGSGIDLCISGTSADSVTLSLGVNTSNAQASTATFDATDWIFIAATYTSSAVGSGTINFYTGTELGGVTQLGGTRTWSGATSQGGGAVANTNGGTTSTLDLGATPATTANRTPTALLDDVRFYDSVLSTSELYTILQSVPEPSSLSLLMLVGSLGFGCRCFRRNSSRF